ncbi:MAG: glycoside hydrolase family 125 protein [Chloroflexota bacterium]
MESLFNLDGYHVRRLNPDQGVKPLDFGYGGATGCINADGRLVAINAYHSVHGYMTLTAFPPFPDEARYDAAKVRAYRRGLPESDGFGLRFKVEVASREAFLIEDAVPLLRFTLVNGVVAECITYVNVAAPHGVVHSWRFSAPGDWATWDGEVTLQRSAYTQLTEGGVVDFPSPQTTVTTTDDVCHIHSPALASDVVITPPLAWDGTAAILGEAVALDVVFGGPVESLMKAHAAHLAAAENLLSMTLDTWAKCRRLSPFEVDDPMLARAWTYGRQVSVSIDQGRYKCIMTDHMLLPLAWNRDAYYVAALCLLNKDTNYPLVRNHLLWMFEMADRPNGYWGRAYQANGAVKDHGYQLDQQIFPFLELAEYMAARPDQSEAFVQLLSTAETMFDELLAKRDPEIGLFRTEETPADDPLGDFQFHFSSHILLWHTLRQVADLFGRGDLQTYRDDLRQLIETHFVVEDSTHGALYAYAVDGHGHARRYHDANDIPLVLMPLWGYCDKDAPVWRNTIDFAFSDANEGGYYDGVLGSVHSPAPWALGDAQELILCKVLGDRERYQRVWARVSRAAQWDGALPEAYHADTFEVYSRTWFAWPNAMVALAHAIPWDWEDDLT